MRSETRASRCGACRRCWTRARFAASSAPLRRATWRSRPARHHLEGAADRFLGTLACRSAIHAHRRLTLPGDERAAAADGGHRARQPVQSRPSHLDAPHAAAARPAVPAGPLSVRRGDAAAERLPVLVLTGPTGAGKTDWAHRARRARSGRDRERRLGAGLPRARHRHRQARRGAARAHPASPDRHLRAHRELLRRSLRGRCARRASATSTAAAACRSWSAGTMLYLRALLHGLAPLPQAAPALRARAR